MRICGQEFSPSILEQIQEAVTAEPEISRRSLSRRVCQWLDWRSDSGEWQEGGCRRALAELDRRRVLDLPAPRVTFAPRATPAVTLEGSEVRTTLDALGELGVA